MRAILNMLKALFTDAWNLFTWPLRMTARISDLLFGRGNQADEPAQAQANEEKKVAAEAARDEVRSELRNDLRAFRKILACQADGRALDVAASERLSPAVVAYVARLTPADCQKLLAAPAPEQLRLARGATAQQLPQPEPAEVVDLAERRAQLKASSRVAMRGDQPTQDVGEVLRRMGRG